MDKDIVTNTGESTEEEVDRAEQLLESILKALENQGNQLTTVAEHLIKLHPIESVEDLAEDIEIASGDAANITANTGETVTGAASVPPDVIKDVLEDSDKGLKEIKPHSTKKSLFKKRNR